MKKPGLDIYNNRKDSKTGMRSCDMESAKLDDNLERLFKTNNIAWEFFVKQAPSYQKTKSLWIMSAKQDATKISRLKKLIMASEKQIKLF